MSRSDLREALIDMFEERPYWSLKGLAAHVPMPEVYIMEVLNEIAVFLKKGPYLGAYQLKPDFDPNRSSLDLDSDGLQGDGRLLITGELETNFDLKAVGTADDEIMMNAIDHDSESEHSDYESSSD